MLLSETKRRSDGFHESVEFNGYNTFVNERSGESKQGGGLLTLVKSDLKVYRWTPQNILEDWEKVNSERQWFVLTSGNIKIAICNCYFAAEVTSNKEYLEWNDLMYAMISKEIIELKSDNHMIVMSGDMNAHIGRVLGGTFDQNSPKINNNGKKLLNFINSNKLTCENTQEVNNNWSTWSTKRENTGIIRTCIDYCLTSGMNRLVKEFRIIEEEETNISTDHKLIQLKVKLPRIQKKKLKKKKPIYIIGRKPNMEAYKKQAQMNLAKVKLEEFTKLAQKDQIKHIEESLIKAAKNAFTKRMKKVRSVKGRLSKEVREKIKEKKRLYRMIIREEATENDLKQYKKLKVIIQKQIRSERGLRKRKMALDLYQADPDMRKFWDLMKNKTEDGLKIEALRDETGELVYEDNQMKKVVYNAFKQRLNGSETPIEDKDEDTYLNNKYEAEMMYPATHKEVKDIISSFKNNKAMGPRNMKFELLKNLSQKSVRYLVYWLNKVIDENRIDECLVTGNVKLLFKKGDNCDPVNYRPITVSPILSKLATKLLNTRLVKVIEENELLDHSQIGFRPKYSTRAGVYTLSTVIEKAKKLKIPLVLTFVDLAAAYDSVSRPALFRALDNLGLGGRVQKLIKSLYTNDSIVFEVNSESTVPLFLTQGVRQGCNLSPTLFNILMKQVATDLQNSLTGILLDGRVLSIILYADDICLISADAKMAKEAFNLLEESCKKIGMKINVKKSQIVKRGDVGMQILSELPLKQVLFYKYLGVFIEISRCMYMSKYSATRLEKARLLSISTINLARNSPCPALFAWRVWTLTAIPAILYGCEAVLIRQTELSEIEKTQATVAKFILQVPSSTANVVAQVLADMEPIETVYWKRVLQYYGHLHICNEDSWEKAAFNEALELDDSSNYINRIKFMLNLLEVEGTKDLDAKLAKYSAEKTNRELEAHKSCFALPRVTAKEPTRKTIMFGYDSYAKVYHEFLTMNAGIGNRKALDGWPQLKSCPLCKDVNSRLNEIHVLFECMGLENEQKNEGIRDFIREREGTSKAELYQEFWRGTKKVETLKRRIAAAERIKEHYLEKMEDIRLGRYPELRTLYLFYFMYTKLTFIICIIGL